MKTIKNFILIVLTVLISSCASIANFPVSSIVPAAEIKAKKKQDQNSNYIIELTAENLAEASRLNPPMNNYSVWITVESGGIKNIGQLSNKNAKTAVLKSLTPFNVMEIFITAEKQGNLTYPEGVEISRTKFYK
jgi:hypothetical protein